MHQYYSTPFAFHYLVRQKDKVIYLDLESSIRNHLRSLILTRIGEYAYDRTMGFAIWDHDKEVFYHDKEPYYEKQETRKGLLENAHARKHFRENLRSLVQREEIRLDVSDVHFNFEKVAGGMSVYQRTIKIIISGHIRSSGKLMSPPFSMKIFYSPFRVEYD